VLIFETDDLGQDYGLLLESVKSAGERSSPRDRATIETRPLVVRLSNPRACVVKRPGFSRAFMWMEILQLLAGRFDIDLLERCSKNAATLLNSYGAYGPRTREQLAHVEEELLHDPDSRRAMVYIGRPDDLRLASDYGMPCTMSWQFFNHDGRLEMHVYMRSWDIVWGLSYDIPCFVSVQLALASALDLEPGTYTHVAGSGHIYAQHFDMEPGVGTYKLPSVGWGGVRETQDQAERVLVLVRNAVDNGWESFGGLQVAQPEWGDALESLEKKLLKRE